MFVLLVCMSESFLWIVQTVLILAVFIHLTRDKCFTVKLYEQNQFLSYLIIKKLQLNYQDMWTRRQTISIVHLKHSSAINA